MKHIKPVTVETPQKAQSQLEIKVQFIVNSVDQVIRYIELKLL